MCGLFPVPVFASRPACLQSPEASCFITRIQYRLWDSRHSVPSIPPSYCVFTYLYLSEHCFKFMCFNLHPDSPCRDPGPWVLSPHSLLLTNTAQCSGSNSQPSHQSWLCSFTGDWLSLTRPSNSQMHAVWIPMKAKAAHKSNRLKWPTDPSLSCTWDCVSPSPKFTAFPILPHTIPPSRISEGYFVCVKSLVLCLYF